MEGVTSALAIWTVWRVVDLVDPRVVDCVLRRRAIVPAPHSRVPSARISCKFQDSHILHARSHTLLWLTVFPHLLVSVW